MSVIQTACDCGQHIEVRTGEDSRDATFRADGKQAVYPGEEGYNIYRCKACRQPLHMTCEAFAFEATATYPTHSGQGGSQ